jgi:1,4-dihydroxy-2-naphthoyl-CoA hydrolase
MTYARTLRLGDTDAAGVVYFASLLSICHEAYEFALEQENIPLQTFLSHSEIILPIVHAEIDFFAPLQCGDRLLINFSSYLLNEYGFELTYQVFLDHPERRSERSAAQALTRHVCIYPQTRKKVPLSPALGQCLEKWKDNPLISP